MLLFGRAPKAFPPDQVSKTLRGTPSASWPGAKSVGFGFGVGPQLFKLGILPLKLWGGSVLERVAHFASNFSAAVGVFTISCICVSLGRDDVGRWVDVGTVYSC